MAGTFLSRLFVPGRGDAVDARRSSLAVVVVIGLQLLPRRRSSASSSGSSGPARSCSSVGLAVLILFVGATVSAPGRRPVHLLPLLSMRHRTDDSLMSRFDEHGLRASARATRSWRVLLAALLLVLFEGASIRRAGEQMNPGVGRDLVLLVGKPAGWIADRAAARRLAARRDGVAVARRGARRGDRLRRRRRSPAPAGAACRRSPPDAFDPAGSARSRRRARPLQHAAGHRRLAVDPARHAAGAPARAGRACEVVRDPHLGTGISKSFLVDWGQLVREPGPARASPTRSWSSSAPTRASRSRARAAARSSAAAPTGRPMYANRVRRMIEHLPAATAPRASTGSRCRRRADPDRAEDQPRRQRGDRRRRRAVEDAGPRGRHDRDLHARTATATRWTSTAGARSCARPTASTSTRPAPGFWPTTCSSGSVRTTSTDGVDREMRALRSPDDPCERSASAGCVAAACRSRPPPPSAPTCSAPAYPGSGYFTSLKVKHVGCKTGRKVTLAHYRCRTAHGKKGRCKQQGARLPLHREALGVDRDRVSTRG